VFELVIVGFIIARLSAAHCKVKNSCDKIFHHELFKVLPLGTGTPSPAILSSSEPATNFAESPKRNYIFFLSSSISSLKATSQGASSHFVLGHKTLNVRDDMNE
jgi:hypothetical protein